MRLLHHPRAATTSISTPDRQTTSSPPLLAYPQTVLLLWEIFFLDLWQLPISSARSSLCWCERAQLARIEVINLVSSLVLSWAAVKSMPPEIVGVLAFSLCPDLIPGPCWRWLPWRGSPCLECWALSVGRELYSLELILPLLLYAVTYLYTLLLFPCTVVLTSLSAFSITAWSWTYSLAILSDVSAHLWRGQSAFHAVPFVENQ